MSTSLILLTLFMVGLSVWSIVRPATLFQFPVTSALLMTVFIIPQCWQIENSSSMADMQPDLTWGYMLLCMVMTFFGFKFGVRQPRGQRQATIVQMQSKYDLKKLSRAAIVASLIGTIAFGLTVREASTGDYGSQWTGVIALYALISYLVIYGSTLSWLIYLHDRNKFALYNAIVGMAMAIGIVLFAARREIAFGVFTSLLLGLFFARKVIPSRLLMIPAILIGTVFVNQAGQIRSYMDDNKVGFVTSITHVDLLGTENFATSEVSSAVSDIASAQWTGTYIYLSSYYDTLIQLYFPAFILGHDAKENAKISAQVDDDRFGERYLQFGSTRTGFSSTFFAFHYFGSIIFFVISFFMGVLWRRAIAGDLAARFYYIALLPPGLKIFTESTERFVGTLPFLFGAMAVVFFVSKRPRDLVVVLDPTRRISAG